LGTQAALREIAKAHSHRIFAELLLTVDEAGNLFPGQRRMPAQQSQVQADAQLRVFPSEAYRLVESGFVDHQAGGSEDSLAMGANHCLVDALRAAKIVGVDDQAPALLRRIFHT